MPVQLHRACHQSYLSNPSQTYPVCACCVHMPRTRAAEDGRGSNAPVRHTLMQPGLFLQTCSGFACPGPKHLLSGVIADAANSSVRDVLWLRLCRVDAAEGGRGAGAAGAGRGRPREQGLQPAPLHPGPAAHRRPPGRAPASSHQHPTGAPANQVRCLHGALQVPSLRRQSALPWQAAVSIP